MAITNAALISSNVPETDYAAYAPTTTYNLNDYVIVLSTATTVTISISPVCLVTWAGHNLVVGSGVIFTTSGALPTGITSGTTYYVLANDANTFKISASVGGTPITTTGSQSGTQTGTAQSHAVYQSLAATNVGNSPPQNLTKWVFLYNTNTWKMFDASVGSQTANPTSIDVVMRGAGRVDSIGVLNCVATSVQVIVTDSIDGIVYNKMYNLTQSSGGSHWYGYFFEPIKRKSDIIISDLPPYNNAQIEVILLAPVGTSAYCGSLILGSQKYIGEAEFGATVGIADYSVKQKDAFGSYSVLQRGFSKNNSLTVWMDAVTVDDVFNTLASYRSTLMLYVGAPVAATVGAYTSTFIYGYYKDFSIALSYPDVSVCTLTLEGLA